MKLLKLGRLTRVHPLHAVRECVVSNKVIASPSWVRDDRVRGRVSLRRAALVLVRRTW